MHHRGFGFVETDDQNVSKEDVFIPKHLTGNAVDGDRVEIIPSRSMKSMRGFLKRPGLTPDTAIARDEDRL